MWFTLKSFVSKRIYEKYLNFLANTAYVYMMTYESLFVCKFLSEPRILYDNETLNTTMPMLTLKYYFSFRFLYVPSEIK